MNSRWAVKFGLKISGKRMVDAEDIAEAEAKAIEAVKQELRNQGWKVEGLKTRTITSNKTLYLAGEQVPEIFENMYRLEYANINKNFANYPMDDLKFLEGYLVHQGVMDLNDCGYHHKYNTFKLARKQFPQYNLWSLGHSLEILDREPDTSEGAVSVVRDRKYKDGVFKLLKTTMRSAHFTFGDCKGQDDKIIAKAKAYARDKGVYI